MPGGSGFSPPVMYSPWWAWLALGMLVLVLAWYVLAFLLARRGAPPEAPAPPPRAVLGPAMREKYLVFIDDVYRAHAAGELSYREAHHRLSLIVRLFAAEARGIRAQYMTLDDLRRVGFDPLTDTVAQLYPGAFSGEIRGSVDAAAIDAQELVRSWR